MPKVVGEMRPGIHFNQQLTEVGEGQACSDEVCTGFRADGPGVCCQRRQNQLVVLDAAMTVFARQEFLDRGHTGFACRLPLDQTLQPLAWCAGLTEHFEAAAWPLRRRHQIGIRIAWHLNFRK
jgi:hypothetical protein